VGPDLVQTLAQCDAKCAFADELKRRGAVGAVALAAAKTRPPLGEKSVHPFDAICGGKG
jgi:hypothetical protein